MSSEIFAPSNLLENCLGLQELIAMSPPDEKNAAGEAAKNMIAEHQLNYYGAKKLEIHTLSAYGLPDDLTLESQVFPTVRFGELRIKGWLAQVAYMRVERIANLAWMMVGTVIREDFGEVQLAQVEDAEVYAAEQSLNDALNITERKLTRPLYVPVGMIESVLIAA